MGRADIVIRIGGEGGEGVISTGDIFTKAAARTGYHVWTFRTYPAEIRGGHAWYQIRVGPRPVLSMGDQVDILVAFNAEAYHNHKDTLNPEGVLIYDPDTVQPEVDARVVKYAVPFNRIARDELKFVRGKNVVVTGVLAGLFGLDPSSLAGLIEQRFKRRAELYDSNMKALERGLAFATRELTKADPFYLQPTERVGRLVMSGNDAIVAGALTAGCRFYAGYPITPASEILESMARVLPRIGGVCFQAEDEMAAIGSAMGASYAGVKAMTATSGPGFSLMTEFMGWSGMAEVPCVIVDVQRGGPSTGMPTKLEQADLNHALYGGHGDFPRIVVAPGSVEDCFWQIINAFNLAERYQVPVIFLSDQSLSHRTESFLRPDLDKALRMVQDRLRPSEEELQDYHRFALTESGVSPMAVPGTPGGMYVAPGLEHDERGYVKNLTDSHQRMMPKRFRKLETARRQLEAPPVYGHPRPRIGVIGWGSTEGAIREAVERAVEKGIPVAAMHPKVLHPLPEGPMEEFIRSVDRLLVVEVNYSGQFARYLRSLFGCDYTLVNKYGGLPFTAGEVLARIEEVANGN